jgi:hypothetical protein
MLQVKIFSGDVEYAINDWLIDNQDKVDIKSIRQSGTEVGLIVSIWYDDEPLEVEEINPKDIARAAISPSRPAPLPFPSSGKLVSM